MRYVRTQDGRGETVDPSARRVLASGERCTRNVLILVDRWKLWLALPLSFLFTWLLYSPSLHYGFLFDDALILNLIGARGYFEILTSSEGYVYYRPIPLLLWRASEQVLGYYNAVLLHLLPLVFHAVAVWLLYVLLRRLGGGVWSILPALLFLTFPFAYQNVMVAGGLFLPLSTAAMLGAANLYHAARRDSRAHSRGMHLLALALTPVALWSHEYGLTVIILLAGIEVSLRVQRERGDLSRWLSGHLLLGALYLLTLLLVTREPAEGFIETEGLRLKLLFFFQAVTYPVSAQLNGLDDILGWAPGILETSIAVVLLFVAVLGGAAWRVRPDWQALLDILTLPALALVVVISASLPPILFLPWISVEESAHLLYLIGLAAAVLWGLLPRIDFKVPYLTIVWRGLTVAAIALVVIQSILFIHQRQDMFAVGSSAVESLTEAGDRHPGDELLVVNAPAWVAQDRNEYPIGQLGVQVVPPEQGLDQTIRAESKWRSMTTTESITLDSAEEVDSLEIGAHGMNVDESTLDSRLREGSVVIDMLWTGDEFIARDVGGLLPGMAGSRASTATLANGAIGVTSPRVMQDSSGVHVFLSWLVIQALEVDAVVIAGLRSPAGELHLDEGNALAGVSPPRLWQAGDRIDDSVHVGEIEPGTYSVVVGVRDGSTDRLFAPGYVTIQQVDVR